MTDNYRVVQYNHGAKHDTIEYFWGFETEQEGRKKLQEIVLKDRGYWPFRYKYALECHDGAGGWVTFDYFTSNYALMPQNVN